VFLFERLYDRSPKVIEAQGRTPLSSALTTRYSLLS